MAILMPLCVGLKRRGLLPGSQCDIATSCTFGEAIYPPWSHHARQPVAAVRDFPTVLCGSKGPRTGRCSPWLPGLSCLALFPHGLRHGLNSFAALRLLCRLHALPKAPKMRRSCIRPTAQNRCCGYRLGWVAASGRAKAIRRSWEATTTYWRPSSM